MELLDNFEKHFFGEVQVLGSIRVSDQNMSDLSKDPISAFNVDSQSKLSNPNNNNTGERRMEVLRTLGRELVAASTIRAMPLKHQASLLKSATEPFTAITDNKPRPGLIHWPEKKSNVRDFNRGLMISVSEQDFSQLPLKSRKSLGKYKSSSCMQLQLPLSAGLGSDESTTSHPSCFRSSAAKSSTTFPPLSSRSESDCRHKYHQGTIRKNGSLTKFPSLHLLPTVHDESTSDEPNNDFSDMDDDEVSEKNVEESVDLVFEAEQEINAIPNDSIGDGGPIQWTRHLTPMRTAIYNVEHDWVLAQEYDKGMKKVNRLVRSLTIPLPDDEADEVIRQRLKEVKSMVTRRAELCQVWEDMDEKQKDRILKIKDKPAGQLKKERRTRWKSIDVFRNAARMCYLLVKAFINRKAYVESENVPVIPAGMRRHKKQLLAKERDSGEPATKSTKGRLIRSSLGFETQLAMSIPPTLRSERDIKRILWVLRATKAFNHLFPAEMETELAKVVAYERYDEGRIIAKQGRTPDRFYYVMTGKVHLVQEYVLNSGTVQKSMGFLTKGMTTDPLELDNSWFRDVNLVAKGQVEVLIIEKSDFARLQHTTAGPPIEFLRTLDLFHEFPCERFLDSHEALEFRYFGQNRIVVQDSNRTPWLHIIKSGRVKVVRNQNVIDAKNDNLFAARSIEELGCVRPFSHADAMLGFLVHQRQMKTESQKNLPKMMHYVGEGVTCSPLAHTIDCEINAPESNTGTDETFYSDAEKLPKRITKVRKPLKKQKAAKKEETGGNSASLTTVSENEEINGNGADTNITPNSPVDDDKIKKKSQREGVSRLPPIINIPTLDSTEELPPSNRTFLTREKTEYGGVPSDHGVNTETVQRKAYVQLDVLKTGDIFGLSKISAKWRNRERKGLEHMESPIASEAAGVILISDGAEIIKVSKRFFLQNAPNNTMLKVETMQREYMSPDEARSQLYEVETWHRYKTALMSRMITSVVKP